MSLARHTVLHKLAAIFDLVAILDSRNEPNDVLSGF